MSATIASRTPEGLPSRCPICGGLALMEPSPAGDAPCPQCGHLLWFHARRPVGRTAPVASARRARRGKTIDALGRAWALARSRLRPTPKPAPQAVAAVPSGDLYDPWLDG